MYTKRVVLLVLGIIFVLGAILALPAGGAMVWFSQSRKDAEGFFVTKPMEMESHSYAITSQTVQAESGTSKILYRLVVDTVKVEVESKASSPPLFVGVADARDVREYLRDVEHEEVTDIEVFLSRFNRRRVAGRVQPQPPGSQGFWLEKAEGTGPLRLVFDLEEGEYTVVIMNADATYGVDVEAILGIDVSGLLLILGIVFLFLGLAAMLAGLVMVVYGARSRPQHIPSPPLPGKPPA